jgi:hypothetical protein
VIKEFWPTGAGGGVADQLVVESPPGDLLRPTNYYVDTNNASEGLLVAYWAPAAYWGS